MTTRESLMKWDFLAVKSQNFLETSFRSPRLSNGIVANSWLRTTQCFWGVVSSALNMETVITLLTSACGLCCIYFSFHFVNLLFHLWSDFCSLKEAFMCLGFFALSLDIYRTAVFSQVIYYKYFINRQIVWNSSSLFAPVTKSTKFFQKDGDINTTKKPERRMLQRPMSPPRNTCWQWAVCPAAQALCPGHASAGHNGLARKQH